LMPMLVANALMALDVLVDLGLHRMLQQPLSSLPYQLVQDRSV
jgi:hypothetical protein